MYLLGYDIGSSSIKAALVDAASGKTVGVTQYPATEMAIASPQSDWAEQEPETWWENVCFATRKLLDQTGIDPQAIKAIGIAYQMHGLVCVGKNQEVLRPSIIWCDSRAVDIGNQAFEAIGKKECLAHLLNSPGNFTASKLKWVKDNEAPIYDKIDKIMLPGDYIAMKLTGEINTTISGLSEGIFWDFKENAIAQRVLDYYDLDPNHIPNIVATFSIHGRLSQKASTEVGLPTGIPIAYRAGDQPNNALALNVINPGEVAATGGTSGVVYGVTDEVQYDPQSRVNGFAHVNYEQNNPRIGVLMCINGAGIQYSWMNHQVAEVGLSYPEMEKLAASIPIGSDGLSILPFGNGAERILENKNIGAHFCQLQLNRHGRPHLFRAALEGIAFAFVYGIDILKDMGLNMDVMRVGNDNLFQSSIFSNTIASLVNSQIEVVETTGAVGAAKGAGFGVGLFPSLRAALQHTEIQETYEPTTDNEPYQAAYANWLKALNRVLQNGD